MTESLLRYADRLQNEVMARTGMELGFDQRIQGWVMCTPGDQRVVAAVPMTDEGAEHDLTALNRLWVWMASMERRNA
jgi:hypothetical protein